MKTIKKIFKVLITLVVVLVVGFAALIVYAIVTDYKPAGTEKLEISATPSIINDSTTLTILTWNIGYAGLDKNMDFFFDGGTQVITPENQCVDNLKEIGDFLKRNDTVDFVFLQEVDKSSKRSWYLNEYDSIASKLNKFTPFFGKNYDVFFVPQPISKPMGKVLSGVATYSKYAPVSSTRYSLPGDFGFPTQLFYLDRCFLVNRYAMANGKDLVLINTHNEAFDAGEIRTAQMSFLKDFVQSEYNKGNYVIAGGDWNQSPPGFIPAFQRNQVNTNQMVMESDFFPKDWNWIYDSSTPSNRTVVAPYNKDETTTTVIDFFLLSPNIKPESVKGVQLDFANSDHNPVIIKARLKQ